MKVPLEQLEPGAVVKTPEVFKALGWERPTMIYAGGQDTAWPAFVAEHEKHVYRNSWPVGPQGKPSPIPAEFELAEDEPLQAARKAQLVKGFRLNPTQIGYNGSSGTDPEFFVVDDKNEVIPARSFLGEKRASPSMFYDGLQAEVCPAGDTCLERLSTNISNSLRRVQDTAMYKHRTARLTLRNHFKFTPEQMASFSNEDLAFRCSSSMNIYDDLGQAPDPREYPWRFAGGHIHIGINARTAPVIKAMVRALDGIVGVASVSLARNWDIPERRRMYGKAGEFRLPKHGLEYRVLSNFWLASPLIYHLVFEMMRYAYRIGEAGAFDLLYEGTEQEIRSCINNCDVGLAEKLIERNAGLYNNIFTSIWSERGAHRAMETVRNGLELVVSQPESIVTNWQILSSYPITWGRQFN